jgi:hypothetical protein
LDLKSVNEFVAWSLSHAKKASVPDGAQLIIPVSEVGFAGEWEYGYGTTGRKCTESVLNNMYNKYYKGWGWSLSKFQEATSGWVAKGVMVCDCQGLCDCFLGNDTNAKGNYANYCTGKGTTKAITRAYVIGEAVFKGSTASSINHVGWICGFMPDGEPLVVEEKGLSYGCVVTKLSDTKWTFRGLMTKKFAYGGESSVTPYAPVIASEPYNAICSGTKVNVRSGRGTSHAAIAQLVKGDCMLALPAKDGWCEVAYVSDKGLFATGYMSEKYVKKV